MFDGGSGPTDVAAMQRRIDELDDRMGVLAAQIHALSAELVGVLSEFDRLRGWRTGCYRSFAQCISVRTKFMPAEARRLAEFAARADDLPALMAEARAGRVSVGVVHAAARIATPESEPALVNMVTTCTPAQMARVLDSYRQVAALSRHPDDPAPDIGPDTPRSVGGGERLTTYALDVLVATLLAA